MRKYVIDGGRPLEGRAVMVGAKNAVLPMMAAALMVKGEVILKNVPRLSDVEAMAALLAHLGASVKREEDGLAINAADAVPRELPEEKCKAMRASNLLWGPMLDRFGAARIPLPGGCRIGARPMDLHIEGMKRLGVAVEEEGGYIHSRGGRSGAEICLELPSVGATENLVMAAVRAEGRTVIRNAAEEPEVADLCRFLTACGAEIGGIGSGTLEICGVKELRGCEYTVMGDRIVGGTVMLAAMMCGGDVEVAGICGEELEALIVKMEQCGCAVERIVGGLRVKNSGGYGAANIRTMPYPGFPTDLQPQFMAAMCGARGASLIRESIFENRFSQGGELAKMGADITVEGRCALIRGKDHLCGAVVEAFDLRCGAALVMAAMAAEGRSEVRGVEYVERGYCDICGLFGNLGAEVALRQR